MVGLYQLSLDDAPRAACRVPAALSGSETSLFHLAAMDSHTLKDFDESAVRHE